MSKLLIETHTRLIREVKKVQIWLNLLIGLKGIKGTKYKNRISWIESVKVVNRKVDKMITAIIRSLFLKSERFLLFVNCRPSTARFLGYKFLFGFFLTFSKSKKHKKNFLEKYFRCQNFFLIFVYFSKK